MGFSFAASLQGHFSSAWIGDQENVNKAQAVIHQLRKRLGLPFAQWDSVHLAQDLFSGLEGDVKVHKDTVLVTYYNAPQAKDWKGHFENLPQRLKKEGVDPRIPWLYNFKLDFRFK